MSWESLLTRARNRRDRLETPSLAHDMVVWAIEMNILGKSLMIPQKVGDYLINLYVKAIEMAFAAEVQAVHSGTMRDRHLANDALSYVLAVAQRIVDQKKER